jgi:hypothetical protein
VAKRARALGALRGAGGVRARVDAAAAAAAAADVLDVHEADHHPWPRAAALAAQHISSAILHTEYTKRRLGGYALRPWLDRTVHVAARRGLALPGPETAVLGR